MKLKTFAGIYEKRNKKFVEHLKQNFAKRLPTPSDSVASQRLDVATRLRLEATKSRRDCFVEYALEETCRDYESYDDCSKRARAADFELMRAYFVTDVQQSRRDGIAVAASMPGA